MAVFVLVHGAWAGGWSWTRVVELLASKGHRVFAPTLSGLGERSHLADRNIDLTTHVNDIVNEIRWKDLDGIVLAGHSYGGLVITGVAEQLLERIGSIVYVDAFVPADGDSFVDMIPGWDLSATTVPAPPTEPGEYSSEADRAWVDGKATPHPSGCFKEKLRVTGAFERVPQQDVRRGDRMGAAFNGWRIAFVQIRLGVFLRSPADMTSRSSCPKSSPTSSKRAPRLHTATNRRDFSRAKRGYPTFAGTIAPSSMVTVRSISAASA